MDRLQKRYAIARLIAREVAGCLDEAGRRELEEWMAASAGNRREHERVLRRLEREWDEESGVDLEREWAALERRVATRRAARAWRRVAAAVVAGVMIAAAGYWSLPRGESPAETGIVKRHRATLVLAGGERVVISDSSRGVIAAGVVARLLVQQAIVTGEGVKFHTVVVPRGGEYELLLADGTRVWMNSGSRVTFPTRFTGATREVEMQGEACFDVARRDGQPFIVRAGEVSLRVLGTLFNVEAYPGEPVVTTLVNGSLSLSAGAREQLLRPGQQVTVDGERIESREVDAGEAARWIHGVVNFTETSLREIMTRLARWYDVEVVYRGPSAGDARFTLEIRRYDNIAAVLSKIEMTGRVRFSVDGQRVYVEE
jgi:ferric-dicitrate binding protein FerR (iron transport regulator)